jgi:sarcosine oxidase/L-pipecolate oxidase
MVMAGATLENDAAILIIGAGVFGLSTALHLGQRGYTNVTVIDKQDYDKTLYSYELGCDAASAGKCTAIYSPSSDLTWCSDVNKILRVAYGSDTVYQNLALQALEVWKEWNKELAASTDLPNGLTREDVLYVNSGSLNIFTTPELPLFEQQSLDNITAAGKGHTQFVANKAEDRVGATELGFGYALDPFNRVKRERPYNALLDTIGGLCYADKACLFALHKARALGVNFIFGPQGTFESFTYPTSDPNEVTGVRTADGVEHSAELTIVAGGGWTPTIVPELDGLCETTGGSVLFYEIPRESPLWDRFSSKNFPSYACGMRDGAKGGIYGFPRDEKGIMKIGYRGTKYVSHFILHYVALTLALDTRIRYYNQTAKNAAFPSLDGAIKILQQFHRPHWRSSRSS